jgi:molybdenum cofactor biosynthesis protein B
VAYEQHVQTSSSIIVCCGVITLSDTRTAATDQSGAKIKDLLTAAGHAVTDYRVIPDDPDTLDTLLNEWLSRKDMDAILTNGGTGISRRDQTIPTIEKYLETLLPGFGELFRALSFEQIGSGAILSRAVGGVARGKLIFALPGSTRAVELAMTRLILPELRHLIGEVRKE